LEFLIVDSFFPLFKEGGRRPGDFKKSLPLSYLNKLRGAPLKRSKVLLLLIIIYSDGIC